MYCTFVSLTSKVLEMSANVIKLTNSELPDEEKESYQFDLEDKIIDLKRKIAKVECCGDFEKIEILWQCLPLDDDALVKDVANEEDLYISFPTYADVKCEGGETLIFWKPRFGRSRWIKLFPGHSEVFKMPKNGKFAVMRSK